MTLSEFIDEWNAPTDHLIVRTSGSTGTPKEIAILKKQMRRSAETTCRFLHLQPSDTALLCLPLDYIAGKMMVVRALTCGLSLISVPPSRNPLATLEEPPTFAAMVPSQVYAILTEGGMQAHKLRRIRQLIIGGGSISVELRKMLQLWPDESHVWSTYGMTETLSHIALQPLTGQTQCDWYTPFPDVAVSLNAKGCLVINCPWAIKQPLVTNDLAEMNRQGQFRIIGRADNVICSGGIKIQIEPLECRLKPLLQILGIMDFAVTWVKDARYGQALTLLYQGSRNALASNPAAQQQLHDALPPHHAPIHYIAIEQPLPTTETGKPARATIQKMAATQISQSGSNQW